MSLLHHMNHRTFLAFAGAFALAALVLLNSCAPATEQNPYGVRGSTAELSCIVEDTLASQWSPSPGEAFTAGPEANEGELEGITFTDPVYCNVDESLDEAKAAITAHPEADIVFARGSVIDALSDEGLITPNFTALNIAEIPILDNVSLVAARAASGAKSTVDLPKTRLVGGGDDKQSNEWRLAYLGAWNGKIAACPDTTFEGQAFNQALASVGLYSEESGQGGTYDSAIANKITVAENADAALNLVKTGEADIAFVYTFDLASQPDVKSFYDVPIALYSLRPNYKGGVLNTCQHKDAARWYLNVIYRLI